MSLQIIDGSDDHAEDTWPDVYFSARYGKAEEARGIGRWHSLISEDYRWQLPFLRRELGTGLWDAVSPYGYAGIYTDPDLTDNQRRSLGREATQFLKTSGCVSLFLRCSPLVRQGELLARQVDVVKHHPTRLVPLSDPDHMWSALEGRARTAVRKAERNGLTATVRPCCPRDFFRSEPGFRLLYEQTMDRVNADTVYTFDDAYYRALQDSLGTQLKVVEVSDPEGQPVAAALLLTHGQTIHYHLSGSDYSAARVGANNLLIWTAMKFAASQYQKHFFLGGGLDGEDALYRFKRSFAGSKILFNATGYVLNEEEYDNQTYKARGGTRDKSEPDTDQPFFPEYRRPVCD